MKILGIDIYENNKDALLEHFKKLDNGYICVTSVHGLIESYENKKISLAFKNSFANVPDGMPIVYFGKIIKKINLNRITGPEFIFDFLKSINKSNSSLITIGGSDESINLFKELISNRFNKINYITADTSYLDINNSDDLTRIRKFVLENQAEYCLIFLPTPTQDLLMYKIKQFSNIKMVGFGAALDYSVGKIHYAPKILQKMSLEWLFRLLQDPKRLFGRYVKIIPKFFFYLLLSLFQKKNKDT